MNIDRRMYAVARKLDAVEKKLPPPDPYANRRVEIAEVCMQLRAALARHGIFPPPPDPNARPRTPEELDKLVSALRAAVQCHPAR